MIYSLVIGITRFLLDVNYADQIFYGWTIGAWLAFFFAFMVRKPVH